MDGLAEDAIYWTAIPPTLEYADKEMLADGATFPVAVGENFTIAAPTPLTA
jgi:hypothetical protein